jgi:hypothetical protein
MRRAAEGLGWVDTERRRHGTRRLAPNRRTALGVPCRGLRDTRRYGKVSLGHPLLFAQALHLLAEQLYVHRSLLLVDDRIVRALGQAGGPRAVAAIAMKT